MIEEVSLGLLNQLHTPVEIRLCVLQLHHLRVPTASLSDPFGRILTLWRTKVIHYISFYVGGDYNEGVLKPLEYAPLLLVRQCIFFTVNTLHFVGVTG